MKKYIKNFIKETLLSLYNSPGGFSARKLTAGITVLLIIYLHFAYVDASVVVSVLMCDMVFVLLLLSIITIDQLYQFNLKNKTELKDKTNNNANNNVG